MNNKKWDMTQWVCSRCTNYFLWQLNRIFCVFMKWVLRSKSLSAHFAISFLVKNCRDCLLFCDLCAVFAPDILFAINKLICVFAYVRCGCHVATARVSKNDLIIVFCIVVGLEDFSFSIRNSCALYARVGFTNNNLVWGFS